MAWTPWKKIADRLCWHTEHPMRIPVCYELAWLDGHARGEERSLELVFAGAAKSEAQLLAAFEQGETPFAARIAAGIAAGQELFYRAQGAPTLAAAEAKLAELLAQGSPPPWNEG
jgi:hypothetical protein